MKDIIIRIATGYSGLVRDGTGQQAQFKAALTEAFEAGVNSTLCHLLARPKAEWTCGDQDCAGFAEPATCFTPVNPDGPGGANCNRCCEHQEGLCIQELGIPGGWPKAPDGSPAWVQVSTDGNCWSAVPDGKCWPTEPVPKADVSVTSAEFCDTLEGAFEFKQEPIA